DDVVGHEGVDDRHLLVGLRHVDLVHRLHRAANQGNVRMFSHGDASPVRRPRGMFAALPGPAYARPQASDRVHPRGDDRRIPELGATAPRSEGAGMPRTVTRAIATTMLAAGLLVAVPGQAM